MWQSAVVKSASCHTGDIILKNTIAFPEGQGLLLHAVWLGLKAHEEKCSRGSQRELNQAPPC